MIKFLAGVVLGLVLACFAVVGTVRATMLAVFPANVNMAVEAERFERIPEPLLWARLPLQAAIVYWIWRVTSAATPR